MAKQPLKSNKKSTGGSRGVPRFGHNIGHAKTSGADWTLIDTCGAVGLNAYATDAHLYRVWESGQVKLRWIGTNGKTYYHTFENGPRFMDDDEFAALKIKVMMSTC